MKSKFVGTNQHSGKTVEERFWEKVNILDDNECWEWQASKDKKGYGIFRVSTDRNMVHATRVLWEWNNGIIPNGLLVCHTCDNPPCVNPNHLFLGTNQDNMSDKVQKDRTVKGSRHPKSKLSEEDIPKIRKLLYMGLSYAELGKNFNVSPSAIRDIYKNISWRHIK